MQDLTPLLARSGSEEEVAEVSVDDFGVLDLGEVAAAVEPARLRDAETFGHLPGVGERDDAILETVDHEDTPAEMREGRAVRIRAQGEVVRDRAQQREVGCASLAAGARRELVVDEEADLVRVGSVEAARESSRADAARDQPREDLPQPWQRQRPVNPGWAQVEARHRGSEQGQPLDAPGVIEGIARGDGAAQGMADEMDAVHPEGVELEPVEVAAGQPDFWHVRNRAAGSTARGGGTG